MSCETILQSIDSKLNTTNNLLTDIKNKLDHQSVIKDKLTDIDITNDDVLEELKKINTTLGST